MNTSAFLTWLQLQASERPPLVMGVLNITPDSFYDGGRYVNPDLACDRALRMIDEGVDFIDIGGESSRPGAMAISLNEELDRVMPVIERIRKVSDIHLSIDTYKPAVMQQAVLAGAGCINDICALTEDGALAMAAALKVPVCLMHMQGRPHSMQTNPHYEIPVVDAINHFFEERVAACLAAGISRDKLILDPGFGFGKSLEHNVTLLKKFRTFQTHQLPLLLGVSRKTSMGAMLQQPLANRLAGGLAIAVYAVLQGASIIRTHDIADTKQALTMIERIVG